MVRKFHRSECTTEELKPALNTILSYRATFSRPLASVHSQLINLHQEVGVSGEITQRLKKFSTIVDKLVREDGLDLSRMQDIGGCRSVLESPEQLSQVQAQLVDNWDARVTDYIKSPRKSGYRAIHIIVLENDTQIEIQLRTPLMHEWAQMVEAISMNLGVNMKQDGDHLIQRYMLALSDVMHAADFGTASDTEALAIVRELRPQVSAYLDNAIDRLKVRRPE